MKEIFGFIVIWFAGVLVFATCSFGLTVDAMLAVAIGLGALAIIGWCALETARLVYRYIREGTHG